MAQRSHREQPAAATDLVRPLNPAVWAGIASFCEAILVRGLDLEWVLFACRKEAQYERKQRARAPQETQGSVNPARPSYRFGNRSGTATFARICCHRSFAAIETHTEQRPMPSTLRLGKLQWCQERPAGLTGPNCHVDTSSTSRYRIFNC